MTRTAPVVKLYRNPWAATLSDGVVLQILLTTATNADTRLVQMIESGEVDSADDSFGTVLLDPTRPRSATTIGERIFATIELGPNGRDFLPNGAAKADAHDRHGVPNEFLVGDYNHLLGDGDFAWGNSAEYEHMIGGGSGLSSQQDGDLVAEMLRDVVESVKSRRRTWLAEQRRNGSQAWWNQANTPGAEYAAVLNLIPIAVPVLDQPVGQYRDASLRTDGGFPAEYTQPEHTEYPDGETPVRMQGTQVVHDPRRPSYTGPDVS